MLGGLGLQRPDEHRAVAAAAHAGRFARRRADQAAGQRQRVVAPDDLDRRAVVAVAEVGHEARDVDVGRAGAVAGRGVALEAQPLRAGLAADMLLPLLAEVAQRAAQRPGRGEALRRPVRAPARRATRDDRRRRGRARSRWPGGRRAPAAPRTGAASPSASCQWRYSARPVCLTTHTPRAITIRRRRRRDDARRGERQRFARQVRLRQRQEAAQAVVEDEQRRPRPATSTPPPQSSICWRRLPVRVSSTRPRCFMPRRSVSSDASGPDAPANSSAMRHQVSGVCTRREPSPGRALAPAARLAVAQHLDALARAWRPAPASGWRPPR